MKNKFNTSLGWNISKLGTLCTLQAGGTPSRTILSYWKDGRIKWISARHINEDKIQSWEYISHQGLDNSSAKVSNPGDLILVTRVSVGKVLFCEEHFAVNQDLTIIRKSSKINNKFLFFILKLLLNQLISSAQGLSIKGIERSALENLPIPCPPMEEQRRIVEVLECWDKGIALVKKLIEQKELQKKGLLQNLVYKQPTCKNFYLGNLFSLGRGRVISKEEIQHNKGTYPVYSSQTSDNGILGYINSFDFEGEYLTWTTDGANAGKVFYRRGQFNCTNVCGTAKPHNSNLVNLYYVMSYLNKVTKRYVSYVGNPKLMNGVFSKIAIPLPEKTTQDWAATVLETADKEIDLLKQKLAKLEAQKKGLMQVLLTGKVRLK